MSTSVVLILGTGPNVGLSIATKFAAEGWMVAAVSRSPNDDINKVAHQVVAADLSDPHGISNIYEEVEAKLGIPNVVIYNAYSLAYAADTSNLFSISVTDFAKDIAVNTTSVYAAATAAVAGFQRLPESATKVFIYTGNMQNTLVVPETFSLGAGKNASAYLMETAAAMYGRKYQFYYADERLSTGRPVMSKRDGDAHASFYWELAAKKTQGPWDATFVKGEGYKKFETVQDREVIGIPSLMKNIS